MQVLRFASVLVLALWIGGLVALGALAAPEIFRALEGHDPVNGRILAGELFGAIFLRFQHAVWILGGVLAALLLTRAALGPRPRRLGIRMWTLAAMLGLSVVSVVVIAPRIDAIRRGIDGPIANLPDTDPRRVEFGRLHAASNGLMIVTLIAGLGLLAVEMRDAH